MTTISVEIPDSVARRLRDEARVAGETVEAVAGRRLISTITVADEPAALDVVRARIEANRPCVPAEEAFDRVLANIGTRGGA